MTSDRQQPLFRPDLLIIPFQLIEDRELEQMDRLLYGLIYWYEHMKDGKCFASNHSFAALLYTTTRVVQNSLNSLEKGGYIEREYKDEAKRNRTLIHCKIAFKLVPPTGDRRLANDPQVTRERPVGDRRERPIGDQMSNTSNKNKDKKNPGRTAAEEDQIAQVIDAFKEVNPSYKLLFARQPQREAAFRIIQLGGFEKTMATVAYLKISNAATYAPTITTPVALERDLGRLKAWADKQRDKSTGRGRKILSATS